MDEVFAGTVYLMTLIQLSRVGAQLADSFIVSRFFGGTAIAAAGLVGPYFTVICLVAGLFATGCQSICSRALGEGDRNAANTAFSTGMAFGLTVSFLLGILLYIFASQICALLGAKGASTDILPEAAAYLKMLSPGTPGLVATVILAPIVRLEGGRKPLNIATIITFGGDVIFDLLAVAFGTGIAGIGFATTAATYLGLLVYLFFFLRERTMLTFSARHVNLETARLLIKQGAPEAGKQLYRVFRDFLNNYLVLFFGAGIAMAGKTVGDVLVNLLTCPGIGVSLSVFMLSGLYIGEKNRRGMEMLVKRALINVGFVLLLTKAAIMAAPALLSIFLPTLEAVKRPEAIICVRAMLLKMPFFVGFEAYTSYLQSIGKTRHSNILSFCGIIVFYIPAMLLLSSRFGAPGTLVAIPAGMLLAVIAYYFYLWIRLRRCPTMDDFFYITEQFGSENSPELYMTVRSVSDMEGCLDNVRELLNREGTSLRTANRATLIIEELCVNTITHGFPSEKEEKRAIEVRLLVEKEDIILRIQDNCRQFNVTEKYEEIRKQEKCPENPMGLILANSFVDDIRYLSTLNLNNIIVTLKR